MNKRQAKKQFKKLHGCNPPKPVTADSAICNLHNILMRMSKQVRKTMRMLIWKISNMSQEEFDSWFKGLTPKQKELAVKLRNKRRDD